MVTICGQSDFQCLYLGFGFEEKQGGSHAKFVYEKYKLIAVVARHNVLATGYAVDAVKLIDKLISEQAKEEDNSDTA